MFSKKTRESRKKEKGYHSARTKGSSCYGDFSRTNDRVKSMMVDELPDVEAEFLEDASGKYNSHPLKAAREGFDPSLLAARKQRSGPGQM